MLAIEHVGYTDVDEVRFDVARPVMLNGIDYLADREDLQSRAIILHLDPIAGDDRRPESDLWREFEEVRPCALAGLLDAISTALSNYDKVEDAELPRMADFTKVVLAAEPALPWPRGTFKRAYLANRDAALVAALEGDLFAQAVLHVLRNRTTFEGTATDLLHALGVRPGHRNWGKTPNEVGNRLKRVAPHLRHAGVTIERWRVPGSGTRMIRLETVSGKGRHSRHKPSRKRRPSRCSFFSKRRERSLVRCCRELVPACTSNWSTRTMACDVEPCFFLEVTEETNAVDYLEQAHHHILETESKSFAWKWVAITLHGALYAFAVCAVKGTNPSRVTRTTKSGIERLITFDDAVKRAQRATWMRQYTYSRVLELSQGQKRSIKVLKETLRN